MLGWRLGMSRWADDPMVEVAVAVTGDRKLWGGGRLYGGRRRGLGGFNK